MPLVESMTSRFFEGWTRLQLPPGTPLKLVIGNIIGSAYDQIARWFLEETDADILLTLEQDHLFPANLLERVANYGPDAPVVGAYYNTRHEPHQPVAGVPMPEDWNRPELWEGEWGEHRATPPWPSLWKEWKRLGQLQRVLFVGLGCTAIRREVLELWPKDRPFFMDDYWEPLATHRSCDVYFCWQAARLGFPILLDCGLRLPHLTVRPITDDDYWRQLEKRARQLGIDPGTGQPIRQPRLAQGRNGRRR